MADRQAYTLKVGLLIGRWKMKKYLCQPEECFTIGAEGFMSIRLSSTPTLGAKEGGKYFRQC
jgi:hypothetical protein